MGIDQKTRTSYHEAGHSVVCAALGGRVSRATIIANGDSLGMTWHHLPGGCTEAVASILAGGATVWELGWRRGEKLSAHCYGDLEQIDELLNTWYLGKAPPREQCDEFTEAEVLVLQVIADYWPAIEGVANWLLKHEVVAGGLVHALVAKHRERAHKTENSKC